MTIIPRITQSARVWYNSFNVKKILLVAIVIIGSFVLWNIAKSDPVKKVTQTSSTKKIGSISITPQRIQKEYLFVPYWSFSKNIVTDSEYSLIYFGVGVNTTGLEKKDKGYENLSQFIALTPNAKERILAIRMVDKAVNAEIIKSTLLEEKIASHAVSLALKNKFDGVLLDYETSAFGFDSTTKNILSFYELFAKKTHASNLKFYVSLYGDTYFQSRPYDVKAIGEVSDKVIIMAYDFSKSSGNPGPGFPLTGRIKYGYDFQKMVEDYQKDVNNEKLVVALGYFGYDWRVDSKDIAIAPGIPLTTSEITKEFVTKCDLKDCSLTRDPNTKEPTVTYIDGSGERHVLWFEDEMSINKKKQLLKSKGIVETGAWAYSYY